MLKKLIASQTLQLVIIPAIIAYILAQNPWVLSLNVTGVSYAGDKCILVTGTAEFARDNEHWYGPDSLQYFQAWWNEDGPEQVYAESGGFVTLLSIEWAVVEEKEDSDVLGFVALLEINPGAVAKFRPLKDWLDI